VANIKRYHTVALSGSTTWGVLVGFGCLIMRVKSPRLIYFGMRIREMGLVFWKRLGQETCTLCRFKCKVLKFGYWC
jgi:hypothetical protein